MKDSLLVREGGVARIFGTLLMNVDASDIADETVKQVLHDPRRAGKEFGQFLRNGCRVVQEVRGYSPFMRVQLGVDPKSGDEMLDQITSLGMKLANDFAMLLAPKWFAVEPQPSEADLVRATLADIGFVRAATYVEVCERIHQLGGSLCPSETGLRVRIAYQNQPMNETLYIMSSSNLHHSSSVCLHVIFYVSRDLHGRWVGVKTFGDTEKLLPKHEIVFVRGNSQQAATT